MVDWFRILIKIFLLYFRIYTTAEGDAQLLEIKLNKKVLANDEEWTFDE